MPSADTRSEKRSVEGRGPRPTEPAKSRLVSVAQTASLLMASSKMSAKADHQFGRISSHAQCPRAPPAPPACDQGNAPPPGRSCLYAASTRSAADRSPPFSGSNARGLAGAHGHRSTALADRRPGNANSIQGGIDLDVVNARRAKSLMNRALSVEVALVQSRMGQGVRE